LEILVSGKTLDETKNYTLATSDFLVSRGGDGYTMFKDAKILITADTAQKDSDVFEQAVKSAPDSTITPKLENRIVRIK
jgi:2',3'-cyclic-nucleotide 2'-phosphodiesterase (5'-nucleotidase family)